MCIDLSHHVSLLYTRVNVITVSELFIMGCRLTPDVCVCVCCVLFVNRMLVQEREKVPPLPPVDSRAQRAIQRGIAVGKLSRRSEFLARFVLVHAVERRAEMSV